MAVVREKTEVALSKRMKEAKTAEEMLESWAAIFPEINEESTKEIGSTSISVKLTSRPRD